VPIPKAFRDALGLAAGEVLRAKADLYTLELRPNCPFLEKGLPDPNPAQETPLAIAGVLREAWTQYFEEKNGIPLLTESTLTTRGRVTLDPLAWHRLGWQAGDHVRVVLKEEGYLRLIRLDLAERDARLIAG
jgi:hypothetical protein